MIAATRARSHGVTAAPAMPASSASRIACSIAARATSSGSASASGHRVADHEAGREAHRLVGADDGGRRRDVGHVARRRDPGQPGVEPGTSSIPTDTTGTPRVSRYSRVSGTSRIAFGPAHTTATGVRASSSRSAEMSKVAWRRARAAAQRAAVHAADAAGREDPDARRLGRDHRRRDGRRAPAARRDRRARGSGRDTLRTEPLGAVASASRSSPASPTRSRPRLSATVAGTAPERPDGGLGRRGDLHVLRVGQPVADERGLEGDDRGAVAKRVGDLGGDGEAVGGDHAVRVRRVIRPVREGVRDSSLAPCPRRVAGHPGSPPRRPSASRSSSRSTTSPRTAPSPSSPAGPSRARTTSRTCGSCRWTAGAEPRRLTTGTVRDMRPRISPDGTRVAFTRATPAGDRHDLRILDLRGGESVGPALGDLSAGDIAWSPDGARIAFRAQADPQRFIVGPVPKPGDKEPRSRAPAASRPSTTAGTRPGTWTADGSCSWWMPSRGQCRAA